MYFGHQGVSEESYAGLMNAIWQWEPKTLATFFNKMRRWLTYSDLTTYIALWTAPVTLIINRQNALVKILSIYYLIYIPYWFFLATHQTRFLLTGIVIANILLGILLARIPRKITLLGLAGILIISLFVRPYEGRNLLQHYLWTKLHAVERQYALGNLSEREYLHREFGCYYDVTQYLIDHNLQGDVIDNWSQYKAPSVWYFSSNSFVSKKSLNDLKNDINFYYVRDSVENSFLNDQSDNYFIDNRTSYLEVDTLVRENWNEIATINDCHLYVRPK